MPAHRQRAFLKAAIIATAFLTVILATAQTQNTALSRGVAAFKSGNYAAAVEAFQQALANDPKSTTAVIDLASAYAYQVVPNLDTPENFAIADKAIALFRQIPANDAYPAVTKEIKPFKLLIFNKIRR